MTRNFKQKTAPAALGRCVSIRTRFFEAFSGITAQKCSQIRKYLLRFLLILNEKSNQKNLKDLKSLKIRIFQGVRDQDRQHRKRRFSGFLNRMGFESVMPKESDDGVPGINEVITIE